MANMFIGHTIISGGLYSEWHCSPCTVDISVVEDYIYFYLRIIASISSISEAYQLMRVPELLRSMFHYKYPAVLGTDTWTYTNGQW